MDQGVDLLPDPCQTTFVPERFTCSLPGLPLLRALAWITWSSSQAKNTPSMLLLIGASNSAALLLSSSAMSKNGWRCARDSGVRFRS